MVVAFQEASGEKEKLKGQLASAIMTERPNVKARFSSGPRERGGCVRKREKGGGTGSEWKHGNCPQL